MEDRMRHIPGPQPGPGRTVPQDGIASGTREAARVSRERRRPSLPSSLEAAPEPHSADEQTLIELRRKVQDGELLSASAERLLWKMRFNGHLTVVVQNGRVLKSGYEEGYFRRRSDLRALLVDV